jgi:hypothetical protein
MGEGIPQPVHLVDTYAADILVDEKKIRTIGIDLAARAGKP